MLGRLTWLGAAARPRTSRRAARKGQGTQRSANDSLRPAARRSRDRRPPGRRAQGQPRPGGAGGWRQPRSPAARIRNEPPPGPAASPLRARRRRPRLWASAWSWQGDFLWVSALSGELRPAAPSGARGRPRSQSPTAQNSTAAPPGPAASPRARRARNGMCPRLEQVNYLNQHEALSPGYGRRPPVWLYGDQTSGCLSPRARAQAACVLIVSKQKKEEDYYCQPNTIDSRNKRADGMSSGGQPCSLVNRAYLQDKIKCTLNMDQRLLSSPQGAAPQRAW